MFEFSGFIIKIYFLPNLRLLQILYKDYQKKRKSKKIKLKVYCTVVETCPDITCASADPPAAPLLPL